VNERSDFGGHQTSGFVGLSVPRVELGAKSSWSSWCLAAILLVGVVIVLADGLSRPLLLEEDWVSSEAMTYEPNYAAFVFGFAMLPLMLTYGSSTGISKKETVLLWFVMCTVAYAKDFSYMAVPGIPVFVTDVVLCVLSLALWRSLRSGLRSLGRTLGLAMIWLFVSGAICVSRGFLSGQEKVLVLRDSAIVVYSMFLLIGFLIVSSWESVKRFCLFFALGAAFSSLSALAWFLMQPGQRRYISYGPYILSALLGSIILTTSRLIRPALGWLLSGILALGVLLANARTIYVALTLMLLIMVFIGQSAKLRVSRRALRLSATAALAFACLVWTLMQTKGGAEFLDTTVTGIVSGTVDYADDGNANFRFLAWLEAGQRFVQDPVLGEGFGVPFSFELTEFDVRPHNTFLTILYKMGLLGFLPAMVMLAGFQWKGWKSLRMFHQRPGTAFLYAVLLGQLVVYLYGSLNLLLESPFLASIFWLSVGVEMSLISLLRTSSQIVATEPA